MGAAMSGLRILVPLVATVVLIVGISGCAAPMALDRAVEAYDRTTADSVSKQLLLNIARARRNQPMHFTAISNIAATYKFSVNAGVAGALTGDRGGLLIPVFGSLAEENPTVSIAPMQGDEFTQRLLTPFPGQKLTLLLRQGYDVDSLLRLLGAELRLQTPGSATFTTHLNRPADREGYAVYRRVMAHLSSVQDLHALQVEPLHFVYTWSVPGDAMTVESYNTIYKEFSMSYDSAERVYRVTKRVNGRVMITNYDPALLSNEERQRLHAEAEEAPSNDILLDIRAGYPGGEFPLRGRLRLRSFHEILNFIGRGFEEEPEFDVTPDPRTPTISENPVRTLDISESREPLSGVDLSVELQGYHYAVRAQGGYQWNKKAFSLLYQLFQMSVSGADKTGPAITISK